MKVGGLRPYGDNSLGGFRPHIGLRGDPRHPTSPAASRPSMVPTAILIPPSAGEGATSWARP